jgi:transcriptional regulator GlxA family with amidase domain
VIEVLKAAHGRGARVLAMCSGAFALAWAGLLDERRAATHWRYAAPLRTQFPRVQVDEDVLYVDEDNIVTSAGTAAGIDACLHLVRTDHGSEAAARIARRMVVAPHREGGQKQFIEQPVPRSGTSLEPVLQAVLDRLDSPHTVASLAQQASMSTRSFARHFRAQTGTSPSVWITTQRVLAARQLLEAGDLSMEQVASTVGFGTAVLLRHHFQQQLGITPTAYRRAFRRSRD